MIDWLVDWLIGWLNWIELNWIELIWFDLIWLIDELMINWVQVFQQPEIESVECLDGTRWTGLAFQHISAVFYTFEAEM